MSAESSSQSEIILYQTEDGRTRLQCRFEDETLWLTQALNAELFQVTVPTVNDHLRGIYAEGELVAGATIRKFRLVRFEGSRYRALVDLQPRTVDVDFEKAVTELKNLPKPKKPKPPKP